jgi:GNAT superfamily N-acetyltransferase
VRPPPSYPALADGPSVSTSLGYDRLLGTTGPSAVIRSRMSRVLIRAATAGDLDAVVELAAAARAGHATHQPVFWRPAADARDRHRPFLAGQIADEDVISLVATDHDAVVGFAVGVLHPAPPVYDPGGPTCTVDDFTVDDPARWATTGTALLRQVCSRAAALGAVQVVVVVGDHDHAKQAALAAAGLTAASQWWTAPTADAP